MVPRGDKRDVVDDGSAERAVGLHDVAHADEHHPGLVRDRREVQHAARVAALALGLVRHLHAAPRGVRLDGHGAHAAVAGVPGRELEPVELSGNGGHVLHQRCLHAGHQLHGAGAVRHGVVRRVHVLHRLGGRQDHPRGQRGVVVLVHRRHQHPPLRVGEDVRTVLEVPVLQHIILAAPRSRHGLNGKQIDEGAAGCVLGDAGVVDDQGHDAARGLEGPGVGVPPAAGVDRLDREYVRLGGDRHVELLGLGAGARRAEGDGVARARRHGEALLDGCLVPQPHGVRALRHRQQHVALLLARPDVLHVPGDLPVRYRVAPHHPRAVELRLGRRLLEVAVRQQAILDRRSRSSRQADDQEQRSSTGVRHCIASPSHRLPSPAQEGNHHKSTTLERN
uniref:Uncharacterized protein n=1 Tax=Zea mays TaxID=4577 RepID=C4J048_MAIZE|nr:unknown [Zea mays]